MTSLLTPAYELALGQQLWKQQAIAIAVELGCAPRVDRLSVRLPAAAPLSASVGDPASLVLDSGERSAGGTVPEIQRPAAGDLSESSERHIRGQAGGLSPGGCSHLGSDPVQGLLRRVGVDEPPGASFLSPETVEASAIRSSDAREAHQVRPGVP